MTVLGSSFHATDASASALLCSRYCSQFGGGSYYEVYVGDTLIKHGGVFTFSETVQFP